MPLEMSQANLKVTLFVQKMVNVKDNQVSMKFFF